MPKTTINPALVALFTAPAAKQPKGESFLMPLRFACQDYVAWTKKQPEAAKALDDIFTEECGVTLASFCVVEEGKLKAPDTRKIEIADVEAVKRALNRTKELHAAYKFVMESAKTTPVINDPFDGIDPDLVIEAKAALAKMKGKGKKA